jgi:hypothetical protein
VNRSETALLLGAIAARDQRTVGETDVLAWHEDLEDLDFADCRAAVTRHFRDSTERIMPAHIRRHVRAIRDARRASQVVAELPPGRFEDDPDRAARISRNAGQVRRLVDDLAAKRAIPDLDAPEPGPSDVIRARALDRARAERRARKETTR